MTKYNTRSNKIINEIIRFFSLNLVGPWKKRSISLLSLLIGYYLASNLLSYLIDSKGIKLIILIALIILMEIIVRIRTGLAKNYKIPIFLNAFDNIRVGCTYAIVLEAFKLGS